MEEIKVTSAYTKNNPVVGGGFTVKNRIFLEQVELNGEVNDVNKIKIGNEVIDLIPSLSDLPPGFYTDIDAANLQLIGRKNKYTSWGLMYDGSVDSNTHYLMSEGKEPTQNMPLTGIVRYEGTAVHGYKTADGIYGYKKALVDLTADFANKTLKGSITEKNLKLIELEANITKNTFAGTHNNVKVEGGFFGNNASEVTGLYREQRQDGSDSFGVFGAQK